MKRISEICLFAIVIFLSQFVSFQYFVESAELSSENYENGDNTKRRKFTNWASWQLEGHKGNAFITNFYLEDNADAHNTSVCFAENQCLFCANRRGILFFDGNEWELIPLKNYPYSLFYYEKSKRILVGAKNDFGVLKKQADGSFSYHSIADSLSRCGIITKIEKAGAYLCFFSEHSLTAVDKASLSVYKTWKADKQHPFTGMFVINNHIYINILNKGLHHINTNGELKPVAGDGLLSQEWFLFAFPLDKNKTLFGTDQNRLYTFDGNRLDTFEIEDNDYLNRCVLSGGIDITDTEFALATLSGGCIIVNKETGKTRSTINYQTGLPDDEVYAMGLDDNGGFWICHEYGLSRINYALPIRNFDTYQGLEGHINTLIDYDSTTYFATTEGVFYIKEVKDYERIEVLVEGETKRKAVYVKKKKQGAIRSLIDRWKAKRELRKKLRAADKEEDFKEKKEELKEESKKEYEKRYVWRKEEDVLKTEYALKSVNYSFEQVDNLEAKCKQLVKFEDRLLVAANTGLYEIIRDSVAPIVRGRYVNSISPSQKPGRFYVATDLGVFQIQYAERDSLNWVRRSIKGLRDFDESVYSVIEKDNRIWFGCENAVYQLSYINDSLAIKPFFFESDFTEKAIIRDINDQLLFFISSGIYSYQAAGDTILRADSLLAPNASRFVFSHDSLIWAANGDEWSCLNQNVALQRSTKKYFSLFDKIHKIYLDTVSNVWIVNDDNRIYKIFTHSVQHIAYDFNLSIKSIRDNAGKRIPLSNPKIKHDKNSLLIETSAPFYIKPEATQYSYFVDGLMKAPSKWTNTPDIEFHYIPTGKYNLEIKARDIMGNTTPSKTLQFEVLSPWYETWWFNVIQIVAFLLLLIGSVFMNRASRHNRISRILTFAVVIVIFKFVNMLIAPYMKMFSGGIPALQIAMSILLASVLSPAQDFVKKMLGQKQEENAQEKPQSDNA